MDQPEHAANPWLETFRLLAHGTAGDDLDWPGLVTHAATALTALPQGTAALVGLWGDVRCLAVRVVAPDWAAARAPAADVMRVARAAGLPPDFELTGHLTVARGPGRPGRACPWPIVVDGTTVGVVVVSEGPSAGLTEGQRAGPALIRDGLQAVVRAAGRQGALSQANMRAVDMLAAAEDLMTLPDSTTEGFDTILDALATGLHLRHGLLLWAPHGDTWTVRAVRGESPAIAVGQTVPAALAARPALLSGSGPPVTVPDLELPEVTWRPVWALPFGSRHPSGGKGLALLGTAGRAPAAARPGDRALAATLAALASAAAGTLAMREAARRTSIQAVNALAQAVDAKDHYTHMHSRSVSNLAAAVARRLDLPPERVERTRLAGLLHDVGKIGIPDAILNKPGPLDPAETLQMRQHAALGDHITKTVDALRAVAPLIRAHHENWDGSGYPDHLAGEQIPLEARIVSAADAYDAMTTDRVYRPGRPSAAATEELLLRRGAQFDPTVVDALVALVRERMGADRGTAGSAA